LYLCALTHQLRNGIDKGRLTVIADSMGLFLYGAVCPGMPRMPALEDAGFGNAPYSVIRIRELSGQQISPRVPANEYTCLREIGLHEV
jgi:hypothetical protein